MAQDPKQQQDERDQKARPESEKDKGQSSELSSRTPDSEPPNDKRIDDL